ncbi:MAG: PKD domain-containing protein [Chloroflexi bacterium]|jgi:PKD repeat protein|nr:PKD domain-containing protein [Chloroflexota bacterium]
MKLPDNIGGALKRTTENQGTSSAFMDIKINMFREGFSERPRQVGYIFLSVLAIVAIAGLIPVFQLYSSSSDETADMRGELEKIEQDIIEANEPSEELKNIDEINVQAQSLENAIPIKDKIVPMIELLKVELPDAPHITSYAMSTTEIGLEGMAENPDTIINYARAIEAQEQFYQAHILKLGPVSPSGKVDIVSEIASATLEVTEAQESQPTDINSGTINVIIDKNIVSGGGGDEEVDESTDASRTGSITVGTGPEVTSLTVTALTPLDQEPVRVLLEAEVSSVDPVVEWYWDFGDGATVTSTDLPRVFHDYVNEGRYTVSLTVTDENGRVGASVVAGMFEKPNADFTAEVVRCNDPLTIKFTDLSTTFGMLLSWEWDFNSDGIVDSTEKNPKYTYPSPGEYSVSLTVAGTLNQPDTIIKQVTASTPPDADFVPTPVSEGTTLAVAFTDLSISASGDHIVLWQWDFGDNSTSSEQHPTHSYSGLGPYTVSLMVMENDGNCDTITKTVKGSSGSSAAFSAESTSSLTIQFYDLSDSSDEASWLWDFGDGTTAQEQNPSHEYDEAGIYTVSLSVVEDVSDRFDPNTVIEAVTSATAEIEVSDSTSTPFSLRITRAS